LKEYFVALISATSKEEAQKIMLHLAERHLIAGGLITNGDSAYWWNNKLVEKIYYNISAFTMDKHKQKIIEEVRSIHSDEVPIITFTKIDDANPDFLEWVKENTQN
jgi:periplasmic divalent cation tolerance protein